MKTLDTDFGSPGDIVCLRAVSGPMDHAGKFQLKLFWENQTTDECFCQYVGIPSHGISKWPRFLNEQFKVVDKCKQQKKPPEAEQETLPI